MGIVRASHDSCNNAAADYHVAASGSATDTSRGARAWAHVRVGRLTGTRRTNAEETICRSRCRCVRDPDR